MQTRLIATYDELLAVQDGWNRLIKDNPATDYPFHCWEWFRHSCDYAGTPEPFVILALDGETIVGILPLVRRTVKRKGLVIRELSFCPNGNTPRNDVYSVQNREREIIETLLQRLLREKRRWDTASFVNIETTSTFHDALNESRTIPRTIRGTGRTSPFIDLTAFENYDDYLLKTVSQRRRTKMRRDLKRLDESGKIWSVLHAETRDALEKAVEHVFEVVAASWKSAPSEAYRRFFRNVVRDEYFSDQIHIAVLMLEDRPVASHFYLKKNERFHLMLNDHVEEFHDTLIPGSNLTTLMLKYAFEHHWKHYDFSGEAQEYKVRLAQDVRNHSNFLLFHSGWKSNLFYHAKKSVLPWLEKIWRKRNP